MTRTRNFSIMLALVLLSKFVQTASAHYRPDVGRWLARDPIGTQKDNLGSNLNPILHNMDAENLYENVQSNPIMQIDPYGLCSFKIKCIQIAIDHHGIPGSHCYLDFGDGDIGSAHNPPDFPKPGPITPYFGPWEGPPDEPWKDSPDKRIEEGNRRSKDPLGPVRTTQILCPAGTDCSAIKECVKNALAKIGKCEIPYDVLGPNSNTSLWAVFQHCMGSRGCRLISNDGDVADPKPKTVPFAPPVGWPNNNDDPVAKPLLDCLKEDKCDK